MSYVSKFSAVLAATSVLVLSAAAAHATVIVPKPVINIPKPVVNIKPVVNVTRPTPVIISTPIAASVRQGTVAGKPATLQNTTSNWQGPKGAGTQNTTEIYQNGKVVGVISAAAVNSPITGSGPGNSITMPGNTQPNKPGTVPVNNQPATPTATSQPAPSKPAAPPPGPAKPPVPISKVEILPAFTDQNHVVKGYWDKSGLMHANLKGPSGRGTCIPIMGFQAPGGPVTQTGGAKGAVPVPAVMCNTAAG